MFWPLEVQGQEKLFFREFAASVAKIVTT